jgi:hypothetical protein
VKPSRSHFPLQRHFLSCSTVGHVHFAFTLSRYLDGSDLKHRNAYHQGARYLKARGLAPCAQEGAVQLQSCKRRLLASPVCAVGCRFPEKGRQFVPRQPRVRTRMPSGICSTPPPASCKLGN